MSLSNEKWKTIWDNKKIIEDLTQGNRSEFEVFCALKKADGFDVAVKDEEAYYKAFYKEFDRFFEQIKTICGEIRSVYELGCGCGVNLFLIGNRCRCRLGGMDYSRSLIESAKAVLHDAELCCGDASDMSVEPVYDLVMEESVFEYFSSLDYARNVALRMIAKSGKLAYFGGVYDKALEEEMMAYRRSVIPDHDERYKGLDKCFYPRSWFEDLAKETGRKILFTEVENPEYLNGKYQYNCFLYKT